MSVVKKKSKKLFINVILVIGFILFGVAIGLSLVSEIYFHKARIYEKGFRWSKARTAYKKAIFFSPFNTKYLTKLADFVMHKSVYRKNELLEIEKAENLYKRAVRLNPHSAPHAATLGQIQVKLFLADSKIYKEKLNEGLANLKKAAINDPKGFSTSFLVGSTGLKVWDYLEESEKKFVVNKLSIVLNARPWDSEEYIFSLVWQHTKDSKALGQLYLEQKRVFDSYRRKEDPAKFSREKEETERLLRSVRPLAIKGGSPRWIGKSLCGKYTYEEGNMYWAGTMHTLIALPEGRAFVIINASGSPASGIFPYMVVGIDGEEVGGELLSDSWWREYFFKVDTSGGIKTLSIAFVNDGANKEKGEDRNLYVGDIRVIRDEQ